MTKLDKIIFSYTYARVSGTRIPKNLQNQAKEMLLTASKDIQNAMAAIFSDCEYEEKLRYFRHEQEKAN
mgnify:CR=1 FL=1|tara:strand:+ start:52 stop:258 length:207 start_codon:yes stop_codon:yes gene_type:complete